MPGLSAPVVQQRHIVCLSSESEGSSTSSNTPASSSNSSEGGIAPSALNAGLLALWACLLGYVFVLAPNQTPTIDAFVVQKLCGYVASHSPMASAVAATGAD